MIMWVDELDGPGPYLLLILYERKSPLVRWCRLIP